MALTEIPSELSSTPSVVDGGNATAITIDANNLVGIGTSSPSNYYAKDLVVSAADEGGVTIDGGTGHQNYLMFADGTSGGERFRGYIGYDHSGDIMQITSGGTIKFLSNDTTEVMRLDSSGAMLLGTSSVIGGAGGSGGQLFVKQAVSSNGISSVANSNDHYVRMLHTGTIGKIESTYGSGSYTPLTFFTGGLERARLDASGRFGIGIAPSANLHVYSAGQAIARVEGANQYYSGLMIRNNHSSVQSQWHVAAAGGTSGWGLANGNFIIRDDTTNSTGIEIERGAGGTSGALYIDASGRVTMPNQPAFKAQPASLQENIPIGANTTVAFGTEVFDQANNFTSNTFTAPITGKYQLNVNIYAHNVDSAAAYVQVSLVTTNRQYYYIFSTNSLDQDSAYMSFPISVLTNMDGGDTAFVQIQLNATGAAQMDINPVSCFSGYLVA